MFYENELSFLCDVLNKVHINTGVVELSELKNRFKDSSETGILYMQTILSEVLTSIKSRTVYRITDSFEFCYRLLLLPDTDIPTVFYIGPFLSSPISPKHILEIAEQNVVSPQKQKFLTEYYSGLPIVTSDSQLLMVFNTFCERIWKSNSYAIQDITKLSTFSDDPISRSMLDLQADDTLVNIKTLERRYAFENEIIRAVYTGQTHMENMFQVAFSDKFFEKRHSDPLRNAKNYSIIMNTLLRKAAEQGGVHPLHLDQISSEFAGKIELLSSLSEVPSLMREMFRTYCRLVKKHNLQRFSPIVQKTILIIDSDLSADLSPKALASSQGITLGYLSTIFKKETNQTITAYIRARRMKYAAYLLSTTKLQIQTIALHCGIMDVQYFSKLFKSYHSKTPTEYRLAADSAGHSVN